MAHDTFTNAQYNSGSTSREFDAALAAVTLFAPRAPGTCICLFTDNTGVMHVINKRFSPNETLRKKLLELHEVLAQHKCTLVATHIAGEHNTVADALSRVNLGDSY